LNSEDLRVFASISPIEYPSDRGANEYVGWRKEQMSWKETCYVGDWSFGQLIWNLWVNGNENDTS
jgi:vanillate/3-O-methylgallate O-demethylase